MAVREVSTGTIMVTDYQHKGKGRHRRKWSAPPKTSLLFSLLFRPHWTGERANWLTMMAGLAVSQAIEEYCSLETRLKWPNDVVISRNKRWRKVGGILQEAHIENDRIQQVIVGIGINVNIEYDDLPLHPDAVSSLRVEKNEAVLRAPLLGIILDKLEGFYDAASKEHSPQPQWNKRLITVGQRVSIEGLGVNIRLSGRVEGTDRDGRLLLRDPKGELHVLSAGDVTLTG